MALTYNTVAGAPTNPASSPTNFFGAKSTSNTSSTFVVNKEPYYIEVYNLANGDTVTLQQVTGTGSGATFQNFAPLGVPYQLTPAQSKVRLDWPGYYRLVFSGASVNAITCVGFPATMTHDSVFGISPLNGGPGGNSAVQGTAPITVTGNGAAGNPYVVGATLATNSDIEAGTSNAMVVTPLGLADIVNAKPYGSTYLGKSTVIGTSAVSVGFQASSGNSSVSVGVYSTSGANAVSVGINANSVAGGTSIGPSAGAGSTAAGTFIGTNTGGYVSGVHNVSIGAAGLLYCSGSGNTGLGDNALSSAGAKAHTSCTAVGFNSLGNPSAVFTNSTAVGAYSGLLSSVSGTFFGAYAGKSETYANTIIINNPSGTALNATQANQAVIGDSSITQLKTAGSIIAGGAVSASDSRLKTNVQTLENLAYKLSSLRPVSFAWDEQRLVDAGLPHLKSDMLKQHTGVIAQELQKVFPEAIEPVSGTDGEQYLFVHYDRLIPTMIAVINELSSRLIVLENRNAS